MQDNFTANDFQDFARIINCMSYDEFYKMYSEILFEPAQNYVEGKYSLCKNSFLDWFCSIDVNTFEKMMNYCLKK